MLKGGIKKKKFKGLTTLVATLIIILLTLVGTLIAWIVVREVVLKDTEQVNLGELTLDLNVENVQAICNNANNQLIITVKREVGDGEFIGLNFIVDDGETSETFTEYVSMNELELKTFTLVLSNIFPENIKQIKIYPIFKLTSGKESIGKIGRKYTSNKNTGTGILCSENPSGLPIVPTKENLQGCRNLNISNIVYTLEQNVSSEGTCFNITAENVILDCNGYWINYSTEGLANSYGVYANQSNIEIKNCNIVEGNEGGRYSHGIYLKFSNNSILKNNTVKAISWVSFGIRLDPSINNLLQDNVGESNYVEGISISDFYDPKPISSNNLTLFNNTGICNGLFGDFYVPGIRIIGSGSNITNNKGEGFGVYISGMIITGSNNVITENIGTASANHYGIGHGMGIVIAYGSNNTVTNNIGISGGSTGIDFSNSSYNLIIGNTGIGGNYGIHFDYSSSNLLIGNNATVRGDYASYSHSSLGLIYFSNNNTLINCTLSNLVEDVSSSRRIISIEGSNDTLIKDSTFGGWSIGVIPVYIDAAGSGELLTTLGPSMLSINNTCINCTFPFSWKGEIYETVIGPQDEFIRKWYYKAQVKDSFGNPLSDARVSAFNNFGVEQFSVLTDSSGWIERQEVIDYINLGGTKTYSSPYTINASKTGYVIESHIIDFTSQKNKIDDIFTLV